MIKRVLVTGASRGIGRAIALRLAARGSEVVAVARSFESAPPPQENVRYIARDLEHPQGLIAEAIAELGGLDAVVHAAGLAEHAPLGAITEAELARAVALHVRAPLVLAQELAAHLRGERREGALVFIGSTLARRPAPGTLVYSATKAALESMTRSLALELAPDGVRVNLVAPGVVETEMVRALRLAPGEAPPSGELERAHRVAKQLADLADLHPLGRLGTADEVAETVLHALDAEWMTGSVLTIDGGLTAA